jgi:hypothetical protein
MTPTGELLNKHTQWMGGTFGCMPQTRYARLSGAATHPAGATPSKCIIVTPATDRPRHEHRDQDGLAKRTGVSSAFGRQKIVENGLVHSVCSLESLSAPDGRLWIASSVKLCCRVVGRVSVVTFEKGSTREVIGESVFRKSRLR